MNSFEISDRFLRHYRSLGFEQLPEAPLLDPSIPMAFVMSAGLVQVDKSVDQLGHTNGDSYVLRQQCFRHFDLDHVGNSNIHLSLFEMPGAFTFWPKSKATTVQHMWTLVTRSLEIDPAHLWVTYFGGGEKGGHLFQPDVETHCAWRQIGLSEERIVALGPGDNLWMQGGGIDGSEPIRKCGPNTEVFFDLGENLRCGSKCQPGCRCGRFIEFANSLFISAEVHEPSGTLRPMSRPFYETVIGTERVAMISQGKASVFEIDCLRPISDRIASFCNGAEPSDEAETAKQIVADYVKALLFLVADGAPPPGKGGRRRIVRMLIRGTLTQQRVLGITSPDFLTELIDTVIITYRARSPELARGRKDLLEYFADQAPRFAKTLQRGYRQLDCLILGCNGSPSGEEIVSLVKRRGLPLPLIRMKLKREGLEFDSQAYKTALERWRRAVA